EQTKRRYELRDSREHDKPSGQLSKSTPWAGRIGVLFWDLGARGAIPRATSLGLFAEGFVSETCSTPGTAAFRLRALDENPGARSRDGWHHGLLAVGVMLAVIRADARLCRKNVVQRTRTNFAACWRALLTWAP